MSLSRQQSFQPERLGGRPGNQERVPQTALKFQRSAARNIVLDLPIAQRLALGFIIAALVAALASGVVGLLRSQSLSKQTDFYHSLLQFNTSLTTGRSFLELMNSKLHQTLDDANAPHPSRETLASDTNALNHLADLYAQTLDSYAQHNLLDQHADQLALLDEAGDTGLAAQQRTLTNSAQRTWQYYQVAQQQILSAINGNDLQGAQLTLQQQGEPTNADALSAVHSLIQLNDRLASAVDGATNVEIHSQLLITLLATFCAFLAIALVGWFISETLVRRLRHLHRVTLAIEEGRINERVQVVGRDEIADVSVAVNAMVNTIVGLLEETRQQRDALTGAAEHLFSDMRIVNAGDLRISATVRDNDPIGVLANAFNFTVGRFRRFVMRTSSTIEQLDVVTRQGVERSNAFISLVRTQIRDTPAPHAKTPQAQAAPSGPLRKPAFQRVATTDETATLLSQVQEARDVLFPSTREELNKRLDATRETLERASLSIRRLSELISTRSGSSSGAVTERMTHTQLQELMALEKLLGKLAWDVRQTQSAMSNNFSKLDVNFARIAHLAETQPGSGPSDTPEPLAPQFDPQFQEFVRLAGSFGVEVNALNRRLAAIIQEMRSSITPFRLEGGASSMSEFARANTGMLEQPGTHSNSGSLVSNW